MGELLRLSVPAATADQVEVKGSLSWLSTLSSLDPDSSAGTRERVN
jgi:hypothetical protein